MAHATVQAAHVLLGLVQDEAGVAGSVLLDAGITIQPARDLVRRRLGPGSGPVPDGPLSFSSSSREVFASALRVAFALGADEVGSEHLLAAIVRLRDQDAAQILQALGGGDRTPFMGPPAVRAGGCRCSSVGVSQRLGWRWGDVLSLILSLTR